MLACLAFLYGIMVTDYYLVRRSRVNLLERYSESKQAAYHYNGGAVAAFIPAALIAIVLALVPAFETLSQFSRLFGAGLGALYAIANRSTRYTEVAAKALRWIARIIQVRKAAFGQEPCRGYTTIFDSCFFEYCLNDKTMHSAQPWRLAAPAYCSMA